MGFEDYKCESIELFRLCSLNSELRGKTKKDRKKNLLQLLWKVIETEKMNEIYENNLL